MERFRAVSKIAPNSLTRTWAGGHCPLTTPSTPGDRAVTKQEKAEFVYASPVTESGRKTTNLTICTDVQFHFTSEGSTKRK